MSNVRVDSRIHAFVADVRASINDGLVASGAIWVEAAKANAGPGVAADQTDGSDVAPAGGYPSRRTGSLHRSIGMQMAADEPHTMNLGVTQDHSNTYAMIQEFGGRIQARNTQYLTVPIGRLGRRMLKLASHRSLRTLGGLLRFIPRKGRSPLLMHAEGPAFVLKKSVTIPARPYMRPAWTRNQETMIAAFHRTFESGLAARGKTRGGVQ